jgi:hypothetical protein
MRRLCLTVGLSAMLALPVWAQQGQNDTRDAATPPGDSTVAKQHRFRLRRPPQAATRAVPEN